MFTSLLNFMITPAHADVASATGAQGGGSFPFIFMIILLLFFYFAIWRPKSKRAKDQQNLLSSLAKGDEVVTTGGILGRIIKLSDQYIVITIANNVEIVLQKSSIATVLPKGTIKSIE